MQSLATPGDRIQTALANWLTWVVPIAAASAAFAAVQLERLSAKFMQRRDESQLQDENVPHKFLQSAKVLVGQAHAKRVWPLKLWRWLEVLTAILWFGFALLAMYWVWWLPLVVVIHVVPAARLYGIRRLLQAPALAIMTKGTAAQAVFMPC